jgi:hypothetical protein
VTDARIRRYVAGLVALALEVAAHPELWPDFLQIVARVPATLRDLARA